MNHPLTEKILEEFEKGELGDILKDENRFPEGVAFLLSAIQRTANEFRVEEKPLPKLEASMICHVAGYNQCAKETNAKVDSFNPTKP